MKKILFFPLLFIAICLSASPIGERKARELAESFFSSVGTRAVSQSVELEYVASAAGQEKVYVYNRAGGGFAVIAGDDRFSPVLAFSKEHTFDSDNMPPAARHLLDCWAAQIADGKVPAQAVESIGNEVLKYQTPLWSQSEPYNLEAPVINGQRCVTGCVATAMAMILYHNRWPSKGTGTVPSYTYSYNGVNYRVPENSLGRTYDYNSMLMDYSNGYTSAQGKAVAAIMKDLGTSVNMAYGPGASSSTSQLIPAAMSTYFGYSKASQCVSAGLYDDKEWVEAIQENIRNCGPTVVSGQSPEGGHAFIADGYTDRGYISFNFGWGGYSNGYYLVPSIEYNQYQDAVFGLVPDYNGTTTYADRLSLIRLMDGNGETVFGGLYPAPSTPVEIKPGAEFMLRVGGIINRGQVAFNGIWKLSVCDPEGKIIMDLCGENSLRNLQPSYYTYTSYSLALPDQFVEGYRIRLLYKGENSAEWQWARAEGEGVTDEIILCPSAEELSKSLSLKYDKERKTLSIVSAYAIDWSFSDSKSVTLSSGNAKALESAVIDVSASPAGSYLLSVSAGGRPYEVVLTF